VTVNERKGEAGSGYEPDPFAPPADERALRDEVQALGCVFLAAFPIVILLAEISRALSGGTWWWRPFVGLWYLSPLLWICWRFLQNPALLDSRLSQYSHARRRRAIIGVALVSFAFTYAQIYWPEIDGWLSGWLSGW
jgi:hypothetical protein